MIKEWKIFASVQPFAVNSPKIGFDTNDLALSTNTITNPLIKEHFRVRKSYSMDYLRQLFVAFLGIFKRIRGFAYMIFEFIIVRYIMLVALPLQHFVDFR